MGICRIPITYAYSPYRNVKQPKTPKQAKYNEAINSNVPIVVATGPAGCGKTLFACQQAAKYYDESEIQKIIVTRPTVAVDEDLGYLPGNIQDKLGPWIKPMMDIFENYFSITELERMIRNGSLEISPLSYMRGRTFEGSFIIADEMQNATINQTKMILTRIGYGSKLVITGDPGQSDLKDENGLVDFIDKVYSNDELEYISHIEMCDVDVQRHDAVKEVLKLYEN